MLILPAKIALNAIFCIVCFNFPFIDNGAMTASKRQILSFIFTVLCLKYKIRKKNVIICSQLKIEKLISLTSEKFSEI